MYTKYLAAMNKQEYNNIMAENSHNISDLNNVVNSDNFYLVSAYNSKNYFLRSSVPMLKITFSSFCSRLTKSNFINSLNPCHQAASQQKILT